MIAVVTPPYAEPVHLTEMKTHLTADSDQTENDALIGSWTSSSRTVIESAGGANTSRSPVLMVTTLDELMDCWPAGGAIELTCLPLISVASITYVDTSGVTQTLGTSIYSVNAIEGRIYLAYGQAWPSLRAAPQDKITVRYTSGMAATFSAVAGTDLCTVDGRTFTDGDCVQLLNSGGALPAGLSAGRPYFVRDVSGSSFKLAATSGGAAIDITDAGTGTQFIGLPRGMEKFEAGRSGVKAQTMRLYRNRGDGAGLDSMQEAAIDRMIDWCVGVIRV